MAKQAGTRNTAQKKAVTQTLAGAGGFLSAQALHRRLKEKGLRAGLATVYRQLNSLAQVGEADVITNGGEHLFRACERPDRHHHHLICEECGVAIDILPRKEEWFAGVAAEHGFAITRHTLEIYGRCPRCRTD